MVLMQSVLCVEGSLAGLFENESLVSNTTGEKGFTLFIVNFWLNFI